MTAKSWDSHKVALQKVLQAFNPKTVFEWGPGASTIIMANYPSVKTVDTVEHDKAWYDKLKMDDIASRNKVLIIYQPFLDFYERIEGRAKKYDLIFVDGRRRVNCLKTAKTRMNENCIVMLHDAERPRYKEGIELFEHKFFADEGTMAILTDSDNIVDKLKEILK